MKDSLRQLFMCTLVVLLCLSFGWANEGVKVDVDTDIAAIKDLVNQYGAALNSGDIDLWMSLWDDNAIQMPPNATVVLGEEQLRAKYEGLFAEFILNIVINNEEVRVDGDLAFSRGNYNLSIIPKAGGETVMVDGKYLSIMERHTDGSWKLIRSCFNDNAPPK